METRKIGSQGLSAGAIGLGCMGMSHAYGAGDETESIATIHRALDCGVTLLDTAEVYGPHTTIYNRFNRWSRRRFWGRLLEAFTSCGAVTASTSIDSTYVKAQRSAFGGKGGRARKQSVSRAAARRPRSTRLPTRSGVPSV